jgi:sugar/nucleoside kinase (ribokinase family)
MVQKGVHRALVTDGPRYATEANAERVISELPPEVLVTRITGAGDTFMAAHIAAETQGSIGHASLRKALDATAIYISGETY